jgi:hypothetical protein
LRPKARRERLLRSTAEIPGSINKIMRTIAASYTRGN